MNYLLDTHILVWYLSGNESLSKEAVNIISNPNNTIYYSVINLWEILLKSNKEKIIKYKSINNLNIDIIDVGFIPLPLYPRHIYAIEDITLSNKKLNIKILLIELLWHKQKRIRYFY